jgi:hypothetical protein
MPTDEDRQELSEEEVKRKESDHKIREDWEKRIEGRIQEGVTWSLKHSRLYQAVDIGWDSIPIHDETIPLLLFAQKKIDVERCATWLKDSQFKDELIQSDKQGKAIKINVPRLYEVSVNLIRSFVTRRVAAQSSRYTSLYPFLKYDARGTRPVDKFRADVVTQRVEIMSDQFNYRHLLGTQTIRDMLLYSRSLLFPTCAWRVDKQLIPKKKLESIDDGELDVETVIAREGVDFFNPHPSRCFWDNAYPLANINTDTGPTWIGYWDVVRFRDIEKADGFFNRKSISYSTNFSQLPHTYNSYFSYYFDPCSLKFPKAISDEGMRNDRKANVGRYSSELKDDALFLTTYFEKINPSELGVCDYPHDVWVRLTVAADNTVVHAEPMPSSPAAYGGVNENDNRGVNASMAHDILPFQDQLTNILSQMLLNMKAGLAQLWMIDGDSLDPDVKEQVKKWIEAEEYYAQPKAMFYSGSKMRDLGFDTQASVRVIQVTMAEKINDAMKAIAQLLNLAERLLIMSPQEIGQPSPREASATEVSLIANTTNAIFSFISAGPDEQRAAVKEMVYDSLLSCGEDKIRVTTLNRYPADIVEESGFTTEVEADEEDGVSAQRYVVGDVEDLRHDVLFTTRDGAERETNLQGAQTLTQLIGSILTIPGMPEKLGDQKIFDIVNEIGRKTGTDFNLQVEKTTSPNMIEQITTAIESIDARLQGLEQSAMLPPQGVLPEGSPLGIEPELPPQLIQ